MLRRIAPIITVATLAATGLVTQTANTAALGATQSKLTPTSYGMLASGYASYFKGSDVHGDSIKAASAVVACTNLAGQNKNNAEAEIDPGSGLTIENASTHAWTAKRGDAVSSNSVHKIGKVNLLDTPLGSLYLSSIKAKTRSWHDSEGFHSSSTSSLGGIVLDPAIGDNQVFEVPSPGQTVVVPGLAEITLGDGAEKFGAHKASSKIDAVQLKMLLTGSTVYLAHSQTSIEDGVKEAVYGGSAYGTEVTMLDDLATSGRTPAVPVPCVGSDGKLGHKEIAQTDLEPGILAKGLKASQVSGLISDGRPGVKTRATIGEVNLGDQLVLNGIVAVASVAKNPGAGYARSAKGTKIKSITFQGEEQEIPESGVLEIPGVATIEPNVVQRTKRSITVISVRVTMLDGTAGVAVVNLGYAKASLRSSGL